MPIEPYDLGRVRTVPLAGRPSLVRADRFAGLPGPGATARELLRSLPDFLAARGLRELVAAIVAARRGGRGVVFGVGGHVVKTGCSPLLVDLMERGVITALAMPGSTAIHDFEIAAAGRTSEDVAERLADGAYGTAEETGRFFAGAAAAGAAGPGFGRALGERMLDLPHAGLSLLAAAARLDLPATVHVAVGTDTVHLHPAADGAALGAASHLDFRIFTTVVSRLAGGVYVNAGSAVVLPEVFLKAVTVARNSGERLAGLFGANLDMLRHYRTRVNVVNRPVDRGADIAGHHEIMLPLLRLMVLGEMEEGRA